MSGVLPDLRSDSSRVVTFLRNRAIFVEKAEQGLEVRGRIIIPHILFPQYTYSTIYKTNFSKHKYS
jgi:hypothetical protein